MNQDAAQGSSGGARTPAYRRIVDDLRARVLQEGDSDARLPTDAELAETFGVSRQTVRRAYFELVAEGLVYRVPGRGSFAQVSGSTYLRPLGTVEDLMGLSLDTEMEMLVPLTRRIAIDAAGRLQLDTDVTSMLQLRRLHHGSPFCVTWVYLPVEIGHLLADVPELELGVRSAQTIVGLLDRRLPHPIAGADQMVTTALADEATAAHLSCEPGTPLLRIDRIYRTASGDAVELATTHYLPSLYTYRTTLRRSGH